jgi:D-amino-acid dehydrogenase
VTIPGARIGVIGAGIIGMSIALELGKRGADVTVIDRDEPGSGCSFGNSGAVSPASVVPLAMPGVLATVPSMLLDSESPLYLPLRYLPRALPWLARFVASARPAHVRAASESLARLHASALQAHAAMARELGVPELFMQRGHLYLYPDADALAKDATGWRMREHFNFKLDRLDRAGIEALEPRAPPRYRTGMYLADHGTIVNPFRYVSAMACAFSAGGGTIVRDSVQAIAPERDRWRIQSRTGSLQQAFDHVVVAAGAWSPRLLTPLGVRLPMESQRGYHVQYEGGSDLISRTVVLADRKVFLTPMEGGLRVGGTVEIGGLDAPPNEKRAAVLSRIALEAFPDLARLPSKTWMGHRPCMPDSIPIVGAAPGHPGLWIATGHGHLGMTDSLQSARRIADELMNGKSAIRLPALDVA